MDPTTVLATIVHDPDGRLREPLTNRSISIGQFRNVTVVCTEQTDPRTVECLQSFRNTRVIMNAAGQIGVSRRQAIHAALAAGAESILYCDFDRWLHWVGAYPAELVALVQRIVGLSHSPWYVCIGRTERAFATHPRVQQLTEAVSNGVLSSLVGHEIDATAGCCWLSAQGAALVLEHSQEKTNATDLEWPALVHSRTMKRLEHVRVEGLEFETAEFYGDDIQSAGGIEAWTREHYESPEAWRSRLQLTRASADAAFRVFNQANSACKLDSFRGEARDLA